MDSNTGNQLAKNHRGSAGVGEPDDVQPAQHNSCSDNENNENEFDDFANMGGGKQLSGTGTTNAASNVGGNNSGLAGKEARVAGVSHESPRFISKNSMASNQILNESSSLAHCHQAVKSYNYANNMDNSHHSIADEISATSGDNGSNFADLRFTEGMQLSQQIGQIQQQQSSQQTNQQKLQQIQLLQQKMARQQIGPSQPGPAGPQQQQLQGSSQSYNEYQDNDNIVSSLGEHQPPPSLHQSSGSSKHAPSNSFINAALAQQKQRQKQNSQSPSMIPRQSIAPGYGGLSAVEISKQGGGPAAGDGGNAERQYQQQRLASSGKQNSTTGAGQSSGTGGKPKAPGAGGSSSKKQQVFGQGIMSKGGAGEMLELNEIDLRISENIVDSGKLSEVAQAKNLRSQIDTRTQHLQKLDGDSQQNPNAKAADDNDQQCAQHCQDHILFCLKCQEKICTKCLDTNHLLHPVVPLNSVNKLDFKTSLQKEIEKSLEDIKLRESIVQNKIGKDLTKHKIALRNHIIHIRDTLRQDFDDFFNHMLSCMRQDWNLFELQEQLSKEARKFSVEIVGQLSKITQQDEFDQIYYHNDLKKFYENLSVAQSKVQVYKQDWNEFEKGIDNMVDGLKGYSEFDIIDGTTLKNFLAENLVMNYSNVETHKILFQQINLADKNQNRLGSGSGGPGQSGHSDGNAFGSTGSNNRGRGAANSSDSHRDRNRGGRTQSNNRGTQSNINRVNNKQVGENQYNICFNRNSQLAMANNFAQTGIRMLNRSQTHQNQNQMEEVRTNKIHFFKFDQKIVTFYNVDHERKQREVLNIDFNIPIRFCSIQTNDGRIFITGGAKNTSQSSNHAYEFRNGTLIQLPNMINPREGHCLAAVANSYIYAIGSRLYNTSKTCEVYSIENNCWREKPELNRNRYLSTAVTIQQRYIYVFGGYEPSVTDIERLDTINSDEPAFWELIKVWSSSLENDIKYWFGACAISNQDILIFGGKKDGASSNSSYVFDTTQNQITKTGNLPNKDTFYQRTFLCKNNKVYAYGYENDYAYIYNVQTKQWSKK